jgi:hypothetical protein
MDNIGNKDQEIEKTDEKKQDLKIDNQKISSKNEEINILKNRPLRIRFL